MSEWVTASMSDFLPPGTTELIDLMQTTVNIIKVPLEAIAAALNIAKTFIIGFPIFDLAEILADAIETFKNDLVMAGLYMLPMWDYPLRQLELREEHGPSNTFGVLNFGGTPFSDFTDDVSRSFFDEVDINRPQFGGDCAMFILVAAWADLSVVTIDSEEDSETQTFPGIGDVGAAANSLRRKKWEFFWRQTRLLAERQSQADIKGRTREFVTAFEKWSELDDTELDAVPIPGEQDDPYFLNTVVDSMIWEDHVQPTLDAVNFNYRVAEYPNWTRVALKDIIPPVEELLNQVFDPIIQALRAVASFKDVLIAMIAVIQARVDLLIGFIELAEIILEQIEFLLEAVGFHAILISSPDGVGTLVRKLRVAESPFGDESMFFAGMAIVVGGISISPFQLLFTPIAS